MPKVAHVRGNIRDVEPLNRQADSTRYGSRLTVLTEPKGETLAVTAFDRVLTEAEADALLGLDVHLIVGLAANAGRNGGAFLDVSLIEVFATAKPAVVAAAPVEHIAPGVTLQDVSPADAENAA